VTRRAAFAIVAALALLAAAGYIVGIWQGWHANPVVGGDPGVHPRPLSSSISETSSRDRLAATLGATGPSRILFGDLHVHTTFSSDAFIRSLPMLNGEGAHPPADACDFARYCAALDFWSINDHAEGTSPRMWREIKESIRQCNAVAGDPDNPDMVSLLGWEWTQSNPDPDRHYGHKNVVFLDTAEEAVPTRPIGSAFFKATGSAGVEDIMFPPSQRILSPLFDLANRQLYYDFFGMIREAARVPFCPEGVGVRALPSDCNEVASTPGELFAKLDDWGFDSIVIPHGNAWGISVPPTSSWDRQLATGHDPDRQILIEMYSGHGNSEEYRSWRPVIEDAEANLVCPEPTAEYLPNCWRAGEIIRERCIQAGFDPAECEKRATEAHENYLAMGNLGFHSVPGQQPGDWLDSGQCRDCFLPAFNLVPGYTTQYALAISHFDDGGQPLRFKFGLIGSSDTHRGRPGVGYKEFSRHGMTDAHGPKSPAWARLMGVEKQEPVPRSSLPKVRFSILNFAEMERRASFLTTGGLVAVHADGRDRQSLWSALKRREVYATSGPRILLWFELVDEAGDAHAMGSEVDSASTPQFRIRAAGSLRQRPGCPDFALTALGPERIESLCRGECYNPGDERHRLDRIEVVRIRPQMEPGEPLDDLIEDPWRTFDCTAAADSCVVEFRDEDFVVAARDAVYYARAIQSPTPKINGANLACEYDDNGLCAKTRLCSGNYLTDVDDDCLADAEERAWSSPIFVSHGSGSGSRQDRGR
jgi:hypothetical protein